MRIMINIHINNTLYIVKSRDDLVLKFLPSGCPGDAPQRFGALGCGEPHRATGHREKWALDVPGPKFSELFRCFFRVFKKKRVGATKMSPQKKHDKGMKHRSLGCDKLLDVSSWDPKGFGARSQPHWGFGTAQALWATGFQESGGSGKHSAAHNLLG